MLQVTACSNCWSRKEPQHLHCPLHHPDSVAKSFVNIGNVVVRREDTSRTRVHLWEWHRSSTLVTCCRAPLERSVFFRRPRRHRSVSCESCAWSSGALSRFFRALRSPVVAVFIQRCGAGVFEEYDGRICNAWPLHSSNCSLSSFVCCLSCRGLLIVIKGAEIGGGGGLDDLRERRASNLLREKARPDRVMDDTLNARLGCD